MWKHVSSPRRSITALASVLLATALPSLDLSAQTLLVDYSFNTGTSTTTATDSSGNGRNGTFVNSSGTATALQTATGVSGLAGDLAFDNSASTGMGATFTGGAVQTTLSSGLSFGALSSFTIVMWLNPVSTFTNTATVLYVDGANEVLSLAAQSTTAGRVTLNVGGTQGVSGSNTVNLGATGTWTFLAVTYDGTQTTNNVNFYVGSTTSAATLAATVTLNNGTWDGTAGSGSTMWVGNNFQQNRPFDGLIDNFALYGETSGAAGVLGLTELNAIRVADLAGVPEPAAASLLGMGLLVTLGIRRKRLSGGVASVRA